MDLGIPVLETPRLILRGHKLEDFEPFVAIRRDPLVDRFLQGPATRENIWRRFLGQLVMWAVKGYGTFAVEEKETGEYVGDVGAFDFKRDLPAEYENMPEAGWTISTRFQRKGYATEAARAALAWIDVRLGAPQLFCIMSPDNAASIRVAEKCRFKPRGKTIYKGAPTLIFVRDGRR